MGYVILLYIIFLICNYAFLEFKYIGGSIIDARNDAIKQLIIIILLYVLFGG